MQKGFILALLLCQALYLSAQRPGPGTCIGFMNTSQSIAVPSSSGLNPNGDFTIEGWFLPTVTATGCCANILMQKGNLSSPNGFSLEVGGNGNLRFRMGTGSGIQVLQSNLPMALYGWNHVAVTADGDQIELYLNGWRTDSTTQQGNLGANNDSLFIGKNYQGEMDEIRMWNFAIGESDLRDWVCRKLNPAHPNFNTLLAHWDFEDAAGTTLTDVSGNGHSGTLQGSPIWGPSSAPIGDSSVWSTPSLQGPFPPLVLPSQSGDSLKADNFTDTGPIVHLYVVNEKASATVFQNGNSQYSELDTTHYWGTFFSNDPLGQTPFCELHYYYNGNTFFNSVQECEIGMGARPAAQFPYWNPINAMSKDPVNNILNYNFWPRSEFIPAIKNFPYGLVTSPAVDSICDGDSLQLLSASSTVATYQWYLNNTPISGANSNIFNAFQPGTYHLTVTDSECTFTSADLPITVLPLPTLSLPGSAEVFICDSILDLDTLVSPPGGTFSGTGVNGNSLIAPAAGVGFHNVTYTVTDSFGCSNADFFPAEVKADPVPIISLLFDYCETAAPIATAGLATPPGGVFAGPGVSGDSIYFSNAGPGIQTYTYSVFTNTCTITDTSGTNIVATPPPPSISLNANTLITNASMPTWYILQGGVPSFISNANPFTPAASGTYAVTNTVFPGCESDLSDSLVVTIVGVNNPLIGQPKWYPNPAQKSLNLQFPQAGTWQIRLTDLSGKTVLLETKEVSLGEIGQLRVGPFAKGLYLIEFRGPGGLLYLGKVLKD